MAWLFDLTNSNLSYYTVPAAFIVAMVAHSVSVSSAGRNYDLANPRRTSEHCLKDESLDKAARLPLPSGARCASQRRLLMECAFQTRYMALRAANASANGIESLGVYAAAVVAANTSGVPVYTLNVLTLGYLLSRIGYTFAYIVLQKNRKLAPVRSAFWMASIFQLYTLFIKAGNASLA